LDGVRGLLPALAATIPRAITMSVVMDQTQTIRASLHDVEATLVIPVLLVTLVVFAFLRSLRATLIRAVAVPVSLVGTFGAMYLFGYSLDNLSLMALTIATDSSSMTPSSSSRTSRVTGPRASPRSRPRSAEPRRSASGCWPSASRWGPSSRPSS
jgi:AcrB/AcrD/AcrF family protein